MCGNSMEVVSWVEDQQGQAGRITKGLQKTFVDDGYLCSSCSWSHACTHTSKPSRLYMLNMYSLLCVCYTSIKLLLIGIKSKLGSLASLG